MRKHCVKPEFIQSSEGVLKVVEFNGDRIILENNDGDIVQVSKDKVKRVGSKFTLVE